MTASCNTIPPYRPFRRALMAAAVVLPLLAACAPGSVPAPSEESPTAGAPPLERPALALPEPGAAPWLTPGERTGIGGCPLFPADHAWHASIASLAVHPDSEAMIRSSGGEQQAVRPGFSSGIWQGSRSGIPFNVVDGSASRRIDFVVANDYGDTGAHLDVPLPPSPRFEGWPGKAWDAHLVVVDTSTCESRELLNVRDPSDDLLGLGGGRWYADTAATFDLRAHDNSGWGATAADQSLLAGLVRHEEVASGRIQHALSATLEGIRADEVVWPALRTDGRSQDPNAIPMGSWFRLRSDVDLSEFGPQSRVVAEALRVHGAIVTDSGPGFVLQGEPSEQWDDEDLDALRSLSLADFEVVDASPMMVSPKSHRLRSTR